jgi:hypothetical protein
MEQSYHCLHFMISGSKLIGGRTARVDVLASPQAINWQLVAIHVECMGLFLRRGTVRNEQARRKTYDYKEVSQK